MATLYEPHPGELLEVDEAWLLPGSRVHDIHTEPVGNFVGRVAPDDPIGTFANVRRLRRQGHGTFRGDADGQREGSFADRAVVEHFPHAA